MKIKISSDSTCDLSSQQIAKHNIGILPLTVTMGDQNYLDGVDLHYAQIYDHVAKGGNLPSTSANNIGQYIEAFESYLKEYDAVIHLNISSGFSSCYQNACLAAEEMENVYIINSYNLSTGQGLLVMKAAELAESGMDVHEIVDILNETAGRVEASFILDQLEYMKKGGRCSSVAVLGANLLKLKPCIEVKDGKMGVVKKYRGSFEKCLKEYVTDRLADRDDLDLDRIFITHSGVCEEWLKLVEDIVRELQPFKEICTTVTGCTVCSHCGPGTLGVLFSRK